ncbi:Cysteine-rich receptor-like protein kinase 25, partial [Fagus crenata]
MWNVQNVNREWNSTSPDEPNYGARSLMYRLMDEALKKAVLFRADNETVSDESEQRYGLVQCSRDINTSSCSDCFTKLMDEVKNCCESKIGWRILAPSCNIRYENYSFFQQPAVPPPPQPAVPPLTPSAQPPGDAGNKTIIITVSSIASVAVVAALLGFWYYPSFGRWKRQR